MLFDGWEGGGGGGRKEEVGAEKTGLLGKEKKQGMLMVALGIRECVSQRQGRPGGREAGRRSLAGGDDLMHFYLHYKSPPPDYNEGHTLRFDQMIETFRYNYGLSMVSID